MVVAAELGATTSSKGDLTELVVPLKLGLVRKTSPRTRRQILYVGGALAIFGAAALAVLLMTSSELPKPVVTHEAPIVNPAPAAPVVVAPKADVVGEAVAPAAPEPTPASTIEEPPVAQPAAKPVAAPSPPARRAIARPLKKPAKPKYDPDALFFKGN